VERRVGEEDELSLLSCVESLSSITSLVEYARVNRIEVLTAIWLRFPVSWDVTSCILVYSF
jgi:hypothetical protein